MLKINFIETALKFVKKIINKCINIFSGLKLFVLVLVIMLFN